MQLRKWVLFGAAVTLGLGACMAPASPAQRVTDAARELNLAARFGRMDLAVSRTADGARDHFLNRRSSWGKEVRVVDVELAGLDMSTATDAQIFVDISWVKMSEGVLRTTRLAQTWRDDEGGWRLVREKRVAGDLGLLGEPMLPAALTPHGDVHFPSRTIRAN